MSDFLYALESKIKTLMQARSGDTPSLTRRRHRDALNAALEYLTLARAHQAPDLMAEELRAALRENIGK